jgi:hypothetical protein
MNQNLSRPILVIVARKYCWLGPALVRSCPSSSSRSGFPSSGEAPLLRIDPFTFVNKSQPTHGMANCPSGFKKWHSPTGRTARPFIWCHPARYREKHSGARCYSFQIMFMGQLDPEAGRIWPAAIALERFETPMNSPFASRCQFLGQPAFIWTKPRLRTLCDNFSAFGTHKGAEVDCEPTG